MKFSGYSDPFFVCVYLYISEGKLDVDHIFSILDEYRVEEAT